MDNNHQQDHSDLYRRVSRLRWQAAILAVALVFTHQYIEHAYLFFLPKWTHFWTQVVFYGLVGPLLAWVALSSLRGQIAETEQAEHSLRRSRDELAEVNRRLEFLVEVERRLAEAEDEEQLTSAILELPLEVVPALGVTLIRFDAQGRPLPAVHHGELEPKEFKAWANHLATTGAVEACRSCEALRASPEIPCPIQRSAHNELQAEHVECLPLAPGEREYAVLNLYFGPGVRLTPEQIALLETMANGMALAWESQLLRAREIKALHSLQRIQQLEGLDKQLHEILTSTVEALEFDGGAIYLRQEGAEGLELATELTSGSKPGDDVLMGFATGVQGVEAPLVAGAVEMEAQEEFGGSLVAAPLRKEGRWFGSLLLWSDRSSALVKRELRIVKSVAAQTALIVDSHKQYREIEYRAALAERERLAREIHDSLAQTLGYLKLRTAQLGRWIQAGSTEEVYEGIEEVRKLLDEAYTDAREAIDGLHLDPGGEAEFQVWVGKVCAEFQELSRVEVSASPVPDVELVPEVRAQLIRILQEALGNVRKHASANLARVEWDMDDHWLTLHVADDGCGFNPEDVPPISRHGLRIMQERAELLGADFQVISRVGHGTELVVRLPLIELDGRRTYG